MAFSGVTYTQFTLYPLLFSANIMPMSSPGVFEEHKTLYVHSRTIFVRIRTEKNIPSINSFERIDYSNE